MALQQRSLHCKLKFTCAARLQKRKRAAEEKAAAKVEKAWTQRDVKALEDKLLVHGASNVPKLREAVRARLPWLPACCAAGPRPAGTMQGV